MVSHTTLTRIRWGCLALNFAFINIYFIISLLWSSFVFVLMFPAYAVWTAYVPVLLWLRFRKSKHTWDRAGAEVAYLSLQSALWLCVAALGIEYRGPSYCTDWAYSQGFYDGQDPHSPFIDTNTGIQHSCDVDVLMNVIACLHLLMLLIWMAWIIYEVRRLPFAKSERRIAFRCGVTRILNGDYDLPGTRRGDRWSDSRGRGGGPGGHGASSRRTSVDAKMGDVELGNVSGTGTSYNTAAATNTDAGTGTGTGTDTSTSAGAPTSYHDTTRSLSPMAVSPTTTEGAPSPRPVTDTLTHTNLVPPLPPRPVLRPPIGSSSNSSQPVPTLANPAATSDPTPTTDDLPRRESQAASDIPPPAYEHNGTNNREAGSTTSPSGSSTWRTMDFDAFMRAQQHKAEYKLFLEQQERRAANGQTEDREPGVILDGPWRGGYGEGVPGMGSLSGSGWGGSGSGSGGRMENGRRRRGSY